MTTLSLALVFAVAQCVSACASRTPRVIEHAQFRLVSGVDESKFIAAAKAMTPFFESTGAAVQRELSLQTDNATWSDIVQWTSMAAALKAARDIEHAPDAQAFLSMIDPQSIVLTHSVVQLQTDF
jgi:hypothetical protein